jgi:hypothetical protein
MLIVVQVNPIAGLLPDHSPLPATAKMNGLSFKDLLSEIIESTLRRTVPLKSSQDSRTNKTGISSPIFAHI